MVGAGSVADDDDVLNQARGVAPAIGLWDKSVINMAIINHKIRLIKINNQLETN